MGRKQNKKTNEALLKDSNSQNKSGQINHLKRYKKIKKIAKGGFSQVMMVTLQDDQNKKLAMKSNFTQIRHQQTLKQIEILLKVAKKNKNRFLDVHDIIIGQSNIHIIQDYVEAITFQQILQTFTIEDLKHYLLQLLLGLKQLKDIDIYHRDIKSRNFLYNKTKKHGVIIDFGISQQAKDSQKRINGTDIFHTSKGTHGYIPLQIFLGFPFTFSSEIWGVGIIMLQILTRRQNIFGVERATLKRIEFKDYDQPILRRYIAFLIQLSIFSKQKVIQLCNQAHIQIQFPKNLQTKTFRQVCLMYRPNYDDDADDLLNKLLDVNPHTRITVEQAIKHKFFDSVGYLHK